MVLRFSLALHLLSSFLISTISVADGPPSSSSQPSSSSSSTKAIFRGSSSMERNNNMSYTGIDMEMPIGLKEFTELVYLAKMEQVEWYNRLPTAVTEDYLSMPSSEGDKSIHDATLSLAISTIVGRLEQTSHGQHLIQTLDDYFETYIRPARTLHPIQSPTQFESWAGTQQVSNAHIFYPTKLKEVQDVVHQALTARQNGSNPNVHVRTIGAGHSWSNIFGEEGDYLISTERLKGIWRDAEDPSLVTVQAGVTNQEMAEWADSAEQQQYRFCYIESNALIATGTVVGILQTMSHGSSNHPPPEDYVQRVTLIDANGNVQHLNRATDEFRTLLAAADMGLMGIVVDITLKFDLSYCGSYTNTFELFPYKTLFIPTPEHPNPLKELVWDDNEYHLVMMGAPLGGCGRDEHVHPTNKAHCKAKYMKELVITYRANRNMKPVRIDLPVRSASVDPYFYRNRLLEWTTIELIHAPENMHAFRRFMHLLTSIIGQGVSAVRDWSRASSIHFFRSLWMVPLNDISWSFKLDPDWGNLYRAMDISIDVAQELMPTGKEDVIEFIAIRFVKASASPLSPAYGDPDKDIFAFIETYGDRHVSWLSYVPEITRRFNEGARSQDGTLPRPHWSKQFTGWLPNSAQVTKKAYAGQIPRVRSTLKAMDPQGLFHTDYLEEVFDI